MKFIARLFHKGTWKYQDTVRPPYLSHLGLKASQKGMRARLTRSSYWGPYSSLYSFYAKDEVTDIIRKIGARWETTRADTSTDKDKDDVSSFNAMFIILDGKGTSTLNVNNKVFPGNVLIAGFEQDGKDPEVFEICTVIAEKDLETFEVHTIITEDDIPSSTSGVAKISDRKLSSDKEKF